MSSSTSRDAEFDARFARIEGLLAELSHSSDPHLERTARELLGTVLELHQRGLERMLEIAAKDEHVQGVLSQDDRVSAMLLLHGLHPIALRERVARTVEVLSERFRSKVERVSVEAGGAAEIVVRVIPTASACASTRAGLKKDWEEALLAAVPDAEALSVEIAEPAPALVTLRLQRESPPPVARTSGGPR